MAYFMPNPMPEIALMPSSENLMPNIRHSV